MTDNTDELRERAQSMDGDWTEQINDYTGDGGGCIEIAEALSDARDE